MITGAAWAANRRGRASGPDDLGHLDVEGDHVGLEPDGLEHFGPWAHRPTTSISGDAPEEVGE